MPSKKISFLIAAHNEENIIGSALENLMNLPYKNFEVLVGLDGCTDKTGEIVKSFRDKSEKIKYYDLNIQSGKSKVIDYLVKKSNGDIIVIHDADWIFRFNNRNYFNKFLEVFEDKKIVGIGESFPVEWDTKILKNADYWTSAVAYSSYFWLLYQKKYFTKEYKTFLEITNPTMFMTNIFRRNLYTESQNLADDFERTYDLIKKGKIILFKDLKFPRMITSNRRTTLMDLFKQKIRHSIVRNQLKESSKWESDDKSFRQLGLFILKESWKQNPLVGIKVSSWIALNLVATVLGKFRKKDTLSIWSLRTRGQ